MSRSHVKSKEGRTHLSSPLTHKCLMGKRLLFRGGKLIDLDICDRVALNKPSRLDILISKATNARESHFLLRPCPQAYASLSSLLCPLSLFLSSALFLPLAYASLSLFLSSAYASSQPMPPLSLWLPLAYASPQPTPPLSLCLPLALCLPSGQQQPDTQGPSTEDSSCELCSRV